MMPQAKEMSGELATIAGASGVGLLVQNSNVQNAPLWSILASVATVLLVQLFKHLNTRSQDQRLTAITFAEISAKQQEALMKVLSTAIEKKEVEKSRVQQALHESIKTVEKAQRGELVLTEEEVKRLIELARNKTKPIEGYNDVT